MMMRSEIARILLVVVVVMYAAVQEIFNGFIEHLIDSANSFTSAVPYVYR